MRLSHALASLAALLAASAPAGAQPSLVQWANSLTTKNATQSVEDIVSQWDLTNLTLAAVRRSPANWPMPMMNKNWTGVTLDINATVDLGVSLIQESATKGARVVTFPEVWFPGYPKGVINDEDPNPWFQYHVKDYIENSLVVGSDNWNKLVQAAVDNQIYVGLSFSEKDAARLYMAQSLIAPDGEILIHRHKLRPSAQERELWSDGKLEHLYAVSTPIGRIGMLSCGEHTTPEAMFIQQAQTEDIHLGSWPWESPVKHARECAADLLDRMTPDFGNASLTYESAEVITTLGRFYAVVGDTIVVQASIGTGTIFPRGSSSVWSQLTANVSFDEHPIVYRSFNASEFKNTTYNIDGELSWGTLQGVNEGFPQYIPQVTGGFVPWHQNLIGDLLNRSVV